MGGDCPLFHLDFKDFNGGDYVTNQLEQSYGVTVQATGHWGGYTPGGGARVFDTAFPVSGGGDNFFGGQGGWGPGAWGSGGGNNNNGDAGLGSPNQACGGPGVGSGGAVGSAFENCIPLGNALVIQQNNSPAPQDNANGGTLTFSFVEPVDLESVTLLNIASSSDQPKLTVRGCVCSLNKMSVVRA